MVLSVPILKHFRVLHYPFVAFYYKKVPKINFANSVDPDESAQIELLQQLHLDLHCFPF